MNGIVVANKIKDILEGISGWTGNVYVYIPNVKTDKQYYEALVDSDTKEVDAWFIRRTSIRPRVYGEAPRYTPQGYRAKNHIFTIRGFQSVYDVQEVLDATSETDFQDRCDEIEAELVKNRTLDITDHTVDLYGVSVDIDYDSLGKTLCHVATITFTVEEQLRTYYE